MNRILIVVDLQNDFVPGGALAVKDGNSIIPIINRLQDKFDLIAATLDWHPVDHVSFASTHGKEPGEKVIINGVSQILWPVHCVQNTWGAQLVTAFDSHKVDKIIHKGVDKDIDSYSAIFDNARKRGTGLEQYLKEKEVTELFIAGLATDYCVKYTALDALSLGFSTTIIVDACRGVDLKAGDVAKAIEEMKAAGAKAIESKELL